MPASSAAKKRWVPSPEKTLAAKLFLLWPFFSLEPSWAWEGDKWCAFFLYELKQTSKGYVPVDWVLPGVSDYTLPDTSRLLQSKLHILQLANRRVCANDRRRWCLVAPPLFGGCWRDWLQEDLAAFTFSFRKLFWGQPLPLWRMSKFQRKLSFASGTTISWLEPKISLSNHFKNGAAQNFPAEINKPASVREEQSNAEPCQLTRVR